MAVDSLEELLQSLDDPVKHFRNTDLDFDNYVFPDEYTNWIEEQRAVRESCAVVDQSYHMEVLKIEGPDTIDFLERLGVNDFNGVRNNDPPRAMDYLLCNPDGNVIGDNILFYLDEGTFYNVGMWTINNWIRYNADITDADVQAEVLYNPKDDHDPPHFRFQIQGPHAIDVMDGVVDDELPDISFFQMDTVHINGVETYALGHGMAAMPGLEIFGPYEYHDDVLDRILSVGKGYDIRQLGAKAYKTGKIGSGWFAFTVPAIYEHPELKGYREWLPGDAWEGRMSIGGSFASDDITDYYMTPMERNQTHLIDFDHDFIGKEALAEMVDDQQRQIVTLVWDPDDVISVYASLFQDGETAKYIDMPVVPNRWSAMHYDAILKDEEVVGVSKYPGYLYYEREMLSLATIDIEHSEPGTEVSFVWGDESEKQKVERHKQFQIDATVAPAPYVQGGRRKLQISD